MHRSPQDLLAREALGQIPKILTLQDRNPHSPTFGCFDRNYWHYKILDFPSGMAQELVWPLALAYGADLPGNPWLHQRSVRDWVEAGILYAARSAHPDGSCDDYFPHERAAGAAAFSLLACLESYALLALDNERALRFFGRRADWLAGHRESGLLSNHQALIALCLERAGTLLATRRWDRAREERTALVLSWQSSEGWFQEYEGCDPGYHTLTVSLLARLHELRPSAALRAAVARAVAFAAEFIHPDGSYAGEYGSRNTYNFFPHGFELAGRWIPEALAVTDRFLEGLSKGLAPCYEDDHILGHHAWNYLLAWRDWASERPAPAPRARGRVFFPQAGLLIDRREDTELYLALNKGGVFKVFRGGALAVSDTQLSLQVEGGCARDFGALGRTRGALGRPRNAVAHLLGPYAYELSDDEIVIRGSLGWAKDQAMTPLKLVALRAVMLAGGRLFSDAIRKLLQRTLITGKAEAPFAFTRLLRWSPDSAGSATDAAGSPSRAASDRNGRWLVVDELHAEAWASVVAVGIGGGQTSIYNVMSRTYQAGQLQPWLDLTDRVRKLPPGEPLRVEREV